MRVEPLWNRIQRATLPLQPYEDTARTALSMNQEASPHQTLNLLTPWYWTSQPLELWEINVLIKPPCLWYFVKAARTDKTASKHECLLTGNEKKLGRSLICSIRRITTLCRTAPCFLDSLKTRLLSRFWEQSLYLWGVYFFMGNCSLIAPGRREFPLHLMLSSMWR